MKGTKHKKAPESSFAGELKELKLKDQTASASGGSSPNTPPHQQWAKSFSHLLQDIDGVKLFKKFLDNESISSTSLDFWFACESFKKIESVHETDIGPLIRLIHKRYFSVHNNDIKFDRDLKKRICQQVKEKKYSKLLFNEPQAIVEKHLKENFYPLFLQSDIYLNHIENGGTSQASSSDGMGSGGGLPTVPEGKVLSGTLPLTSRNLMATRYTRAAPRNDGVYPPLIPVAPSPQHVSYIVTTRQATTTHSLSSGATTDGTLTDQSLDTHKTVNREQEVMVPCTRRELPNKVLAEKYPKEFARILILKLEGLRKEDEEKEEVLNSMVKNIGKLRVTELEAEKILDTHLDNVDRIWWPPKHPKHRVPSMISRDSGVSGVGEEIKTPKRHHSSRESSRNEFVSRWVQDVADVPGRTVVGYYWGEETYPFRMTVPSEALTLSQFKNLLPKTSSSYRCFFKAPCPDFQISWQEVTDDQSLLPKFEGKVIAKVRL